MRKASYEFESGYAKPVYRGVVFWNGSEDEIGPDNPERMFDDLIYDLIGTEGSLTRSYDLKGIKVTIEIEDVAAL